MVEYNSVKISCHEMGQDIYWRDQMLNCIRIFV